jgi:hypothetical protein
MMVPVHSSAAEYMQSHRDNLFDRWTILLLAGVAVFMVWAASHYTVFDDEAFSCRRYAMPLGEIIAALYNGVEPDPPLYYIAQNVWVHLFGVAPLALRGLSIILFLAGLLVVRVATRAWFDDRTSRWAMLICAVHPAHLFFGFAARWYSLMFLLVATLLWSTARASQDARPPWRRIVAWSIIAAAVCYTNYFGLVIVGLCWLVAINRGRGTHLVVQRLVCAGLIALALYAVWLPAFWRTATTFGGDHSFMSYVGSASRTTMALLSGNLASIGALWCWLPLAVLGLCVIVLLVRLRRAVWHVGLVGVGCFVAGVLSRTMIDKYVMTFSGVLCVLLAALLVFDRGAVPHGVRRWRRVAAVCLVIGWLGCGVNLVSGRYWSSLRWHDPFRAGDRQSACNGRRAAAPVLGDDASVGAVLLRAELCPPGGSRGLARQHVVSHRRAIWRRCIRRGVAPRRRMARSRARQLRCRLRHARVGARTDDGQACAVTGDAGNKRLRRSGGRLGRTPRRTRKSIRRNGPARISRRPRRSTQGPHRPQCPPPALADHGSDVAEEVAAGACSSISIASINAARMGAAPPLWPASSTMISFEPGIDWCRR